MDYKKLYISIIVRILLIFVTCLVLSYLVLDTKIYYNIIVVSILLLVQVFLLIKHLNKTNHLLEKFFMNIKEGEYSMNFSNTLSNTPYGEMGKLADEIIEIINSSRIKEQYHYQYLKYIFEHIPVGLITLNLDGRIEMSNTSFCKLFKLNNPQHIKEIGKTAPSLPDKIITLNPGRQMLEKVTVSGNIEYLSIKCSLLKIGPNEIKLISFQSIKQELETSEVESWQKFTRILSHEIMNSVTPIISLSKHLKERFEQSEQANLSQDLNQTIDSLKLIEERSLGLKDFINKYRNITQNITLIPEQINVVDLAEEMALFFHESFKESNISYSFQVTPENLNISADKKLITQVLINLIKNSLESLDKSIKGSIFFKSFRDENNRIRIQIIDNGPGIAPEEIENIFIPFYTRKEGGSGIGLSFSRQIMKTHGGSIEVTSEPNQQTIFTLIL
ncbi:MAG: PAS domain-containing sensor histidine kinase [Tenuifilaceae bacterium]